MLPALDLGCRIEAGDLAPPPVIDLVTHVIYSRSITFIVRGFSTSVLNLSSAATNLLIAALAGYSRSRSRNRPESPARASSGPLLRVGYGPIGICAGGRHCEHLRDREHELRDRLAYTPPHSEERKRLEHRLREVHYKREQCWRR